MVDHINREAPTVSIKFSPEVEELLYPAEVAQIAKTNINTLAYWRNQGTGPRFAKIGRRVVYRRSEVLAWIEARFNDQTSA